VRQTASKDSACRAPDGDWGWTKLGPLSGLPEASQPGDGALSPTVLDVDGVLHVWYAEKTGSSYTLLHTTSTDDGATFAMPAVVTGLGADHMAAYPSVTRENGHYDMLFGSGTFQRATSDDGVAFTLSPAPLLRASFDSSRFDALSILYPSRVTDGDSTTLFFSGFDGHHVRIGRALEQADGSFVVDPPRPVVDLGAPTDFDNSAAAQPHVERAFGRWWMWYGGYDVSHTNPGPYRIGTATSDDGVVWEKHGVALDLSSQGTDAWSTRDPALVPRVGRWLMIYVGLGDDGRYRLHRATSDVCSLE
jgi:hypothetical protein